MRQRMLTLALRVLDMMRRQIRAARIRRSRILTARTLDSLPHALRRDIGWPDRYADLRLEEEWSIPTDVARPVAGPPVSLRRRSGRPARQVLHRGAEQACFRRLPAAGKHPVSS